MARTVTMTSMTLVELLLLIPLAVARDLANCTRTRLCNGDFFCTDVCKLGSVIPDPHTSRAVSHRTPSAQ